MRKYKTKPFGSLPKSELQPVEANSPRLTKAQRSDHTAATNKKILTTLNALLRSAKKAQSWIEDIEALGGHLHDKLTEIKGMLPTPDHGIAGGYEFPPLALKDIPNVTPTQEHAMAHDVLARSSFAAVTMGFGTWPSDQYAAFVGSGRRFVTTFVEKCANHSEARDQALAKAEGVERDNPADILVIGPWHGTPDRAQEGTIVAVHWTTSMYELENPYATPEEEK